jgi:CPA2 family monovalent cation:H+ antiporter-2
MLGIVNDSQLIATFSELGAILLLFAVGIEFSISRLIKSGLRAVFITAFKMGLLFIFGYEVALYFGLNLTAALAMGVMLSITSTAIMFKIVSEKGMAKSKVMPLLFSMMIVEDLAALAALTFFSSLNAVSPTYEDKSVSLLISLGILGVFYLFLRRHASDAIYRLTSSFSDEVLIFLSFSLCLIMSMVASFFGLSPAIGAFLAGSILSSLPNVKRIEKTIRPLLLMFASLFFLSLGMRIDPSLVASNLWFSLAITAVFAIVCFISVLSLLYVTGSSPKDALFGASSMVVLGEFSLLIASVYSGPDAQLLVAAGSFGVIATAMISSFLLDRQQLLYSFGQSFLPANARRTAGLLSEYFTGLLRDFSPQGSFWKVSRICWHCTNQRLAKIAAIALLVIMLRFSIGFFNIASGKTASDLRAGILILGIIFLFYYGWGILSDLQPVFTALSSSIARHKKDAPEETIILRDAAISLFLIVAALNANEAVSFLSLPPAFNLADDLLFALSLVFLWDLFVHAGRLHRSYKKSRASN